MPTIFHGEDDEDIRELVEAYFTEQGYDLQCFENGQKVYEALKSRAPDLLLLDLVMPNMTGLEICRRIHGDPMYKNMKIMMASGMFSSEDVDEASDLGVTSFVSKPFKISELYERIESLIGPPKASGSEAELAEMSGFFAPNINILDYLNVNDNNFFRDSLDIKSVFRAYPFSYNSDRICVLIPTGISIKKLKTLSEEELDRLLICLIKKGQKWNRTLYSILITDLDTGGIRTLEDLYKL